MDNSDQKSITPLNWIFLKLGGASSHVGNMISQFNIVNTLYSRGFVNVTEGDIEDTLLSKKLNPLFDGFQKAIHRQTFIDRFENKLFRTEIKKLIYDGIEPSSDEAREYNFEKTEDNQNRFTKTVELLIAYLCVKELKAFSASFEIKCMALLKVVITIVYQTLKINSFILKSKQEKTKILNPRPYNVLLIDTIS